MSKTKRVVQGSKNTFSKFWRGFRSPFAAIKYAFQHPGTLKFALPPIPIIGGLLIGMFYLTFSYSADLLTWAWAEPTTLEWYVTWLLNPLWHVLRFLTLMTTSALGVIAVIIASIPLAGPFMEMLSEKVETLETGFEAPFSLTVMVRNTGLSLIHALMLGATGLFVAVVGLGIGLIPFIGPVISFIISMTIIPMLVGFNPFDYPMTIRLWSFRDKFKFMWDNLPIVYGFSLCTYLMLYVPFLNLFLLPLCVIAATRLLIELKNEGHANFRDRRQEILVQRGKLPAKDQQFDTETSIAAEETVPAREPAEVQA